MKTQACIYYYTFTCSLPSLFIIYFFFFTGFPLPRCNISGWMGALGGHRSFAYVKTSKKNNFTGHEGERRRHKTRTHLRAGFCVKAGRLPLIMAGCNKHKEGSRQSDSRLLRNKRRAGVKTRPEQNPLHPPSIRSSRRVCRLKPGIK